MSIEQHARKEIDILIKTCGEDTPIIKEFIPEILQLCKKFGGSGQSGGSAPYVSSAITQTLSKLLAFKPICPIQGTDDEWANQDFDGKGSAQNNRLSSVFKNSDEKAYYLDAIVWQGEDEWDTFSGSVNGIKSRQFISFPFEPKTFYIDVKKETLFDDHTEEPFYENKYYDEDEYKKTGVKNWKTEKYRYVIKDRSQLKDVSEYYDTDFDTDFD